MRVQHLRSLTVGRASEDEGSIVKRTTPISIQATVIAGIPSEISTEYAMKL